MATAVREPRSQRSRERIQVVRPIDQIPVVGATPGGEATGAWAYFLKDAPGCATIRDIVHLFPNGGQPQLDNPRERRAFSTNSENYQHYYGLKGFEYVGQNLTEGAMERIVEIMQANRQDEIDFCLDEIDDATELLKNGALPAVIDQAKARIRAFKARIALLEAPFDADALVKELKDVARAQQLAAIDPAILRVMQSLIGEANSEMMTKVQHFRSATPEAVSSDPDLPSSGGYKPVRGRPKGSTRRGMDFRGVDAASKDSSTGFIDADA